MLATDSVLVAVTDVVCCIVHFKLKRTRVHYDVTTFCDVCETANGLRLLCFTCTLRSGEVDECMYVVVDSEYHHQQLNHLASLAKWLSVRLRTKWFWVRVQLQSLHLQISRLLRARSSLTFRQL